MALNHLSVVLCLGIFFFWLFWSLFGQKYIACGDKIGFRPFSFNLLMVCCYFFVFCSFFFSRNRGTIARRACLLGESTMGGQLPDFFVIKIEDDADVLGV